MIGPLSRWREASRVEVYTVHEPPDAPADRIDRAERLQFMKDGFSWGAFLLGPLWLVVKSEWLGLLGYFVVAIVISMVCGALGSNPSWIMLAFLALNLFLGFEAASLQRWSKERAGWTELGTVSGRNSAECERRFFESWLQSEPMISSHDARRAAGTLAASAGDVGRRSLAPTPQSWRNMLGMKT